MKTAVCKQCSKEFEVDDSTRNWKHVRLCSDECRRGVAADAKRSKYKPKKSKVKTCHQCDSLFTPIASIGKRQKFCSRECAVNGKRGEGHKKWLAERIESCCPQCGQLFYPKKFVGSNQIYCSKSCRGTAILSQADGRYVRPKSYIQEFKHVRPIVLDRDGHKCTICGSGERLHVHHLDNSGGTNHFDNSPDNLLTLCATCHRAMHQVTLTKMNGEWGVNGKIFDIMKIDGNLPIQR